MKRNLNTGGRTRGVLPWSARSGLFAPVILMVGAMFSASAQAQQSDPRALRPVEQGVADTGPLSASRRVVPLDLRVPSGFDRVYKFGQGSSSKFARISGGLTAVFPRSNYAQGSSGVVAEIPPGTVFFVGRLPDSFFGGGVAGLGAKSFARAANLVETSAIGLARAPVDRPEDTHAQARAGVVKAPAERGVGVVLSVFGDDEFRRRRVSALLDRANRGSNHAPSPSDAPTAGTAPRDR